MRVSLYIKVIHLFIVLARAYLVCYLGTRVRVTQITDILLQRMGLKER